MELVGQWEFGFVSSGELLKVFEGVSATITIVTQEA